MHIVLDTNIIVSEGYGTSRRFKLFLSVARTLNYSVYVPEIVIDEVVAKFSRVSECETRSLRKHMTNLSRMLSRSLSDPLDALDMAGQTECFRNRLLAQLCQAGVQKLGYPSIPHRKVATRANSRKKPFDKKGSGYRDTLIWMTVLDLVPSVDAQIVLVSTDRAFQGKGTELDHQLIVESKGIANGTTEVALATDLNTLIGDYIRPNLQNVPWSDPLAILDQLTHDAPEKLEEKIREEYAHRELDSSQIGLTWEFESPALQSISDFCSSDEINVVVNKLDDDQHLVKVGGNFTGEFDVFMLKANWYAYEDDPRLSLVDWDWNDHGVLVNICMVVGLEAYCIVDNDGNVRDDFESVSIVPALPPDR